MWLWKNKKKKKKKKNDNTAQQEEIVFKQKPKATAPTGSGLQEQMDDGYVEPDDNDTGVSARDILRERHCKCSWRSRMRLVGDCPPHLHTHEDFPTLGIEQQAFEKAERILKQAKEEEWTELHLSREMGFYWYSVLRQLPDSIGRVKSLRRIMLYGSALYEIPRTIGNLENLEYFDVYTSYSLHYVPYELMHCSKLKDSRMSCRAYYGNSRNDALFPQLPKDSRMGSTHGESLREIAGRAVLLQMGAEKVAKDKKIPSDLKEFLSGLLEPCSVCRGPMLRGKALYRWVTAYKGTDLWPMLVRACSTSCADKAEEKAYKKKHTVKL